MARSVLIVEDEAAVIVLVTRLLTAREVIGASTLEEGLERAASLFPPPAAVLLDLGLPDGSGAEAVERMVKVCEERGVPVLVLTGRDGRAWIPDVMRAGADDLIEKGSAASLRDTLEDAIVKASCRRTYHNTRFALTAAESGPLLRQIREELQTAHRDREESLVRFLTRAWERATPATKGAVSTLLVTLMGLATTGLTVAAHRLQALLP